MRRFIVLVSMFCFAVILSISCDKVKITPAPEVEVVYFDPFGFTVLPSDTFVEIKELHFQVQNHVDAIVKNMSYDFYSVDDNSVVASGPSQGWGLLLTGEMGD